MAKSVSTASAVRAWAVKNLSSITGLPEGYTVGTRGRLHPRVREAYDKAHPRAKYVVGHAEPTTVKHTVVVQGKDGRKRPITKNVPVQHARALALAAGMEGVKSRGRLPESVLSAYVRGEFDGVTLPTPESTPEA